MNKDIDEQLRNALSLLALGLSGIEDGSERLVVVFQNRLVDHFLQGRHAEGYGDFRSGRQIEDPFFRPSQEVRLRQSLKPMHPK